MFTTPGIIRSNEPNEFFIEIFPGGILLDKYMDLTVISICRVIKTYLIYADGKLRVTINENDRLELKGYKLDTMKYISFLSPIEGVLTEFFYNCKN